MRFYIFFGVSLIFAICATNTQWFSTSSDKLQLTSERLLKQGIFLGSRNLDGKENLYSKEVNGWLFPDTTRKYKLEKWLDIELNKFDSSLIFLHILEDGHHLSISKDQTDEINEVSVREIANKENKAIERRKREIELFEVRNLTHFDLKHASNDKLLDFLKGKWNGAIDFGLDLGEPHIDFYDIEIHGNSIIIQKASGANYRSEEKRQYFPLLSSQFTLTHQLGARRFSDRVKTANASQVFLVMEQMKGLQLYLEQTVGYTGELGEVELVGQYGSYWYGFKKK